MDKIDRAIQKQLEAVGSKLPTNKAASENDMVTQDKLSIDGRMPTNKIKVFMKQFPWIELYVDALTIRKVYVSRLESTLLYYHSYVYTGGDCYADKMFLLDENGHLVTGETTEIITRKKFFLFGEMMQKKITKHFSGKFTPSRRTLFKIIEMFGEKVRAVKYILSYNEATRAVILYKMPRNKDLYQLYEDDEEMADASLMKLLSEI